MLYAYVLTSSAHHVGIGIGEVTRVGVGVVGDSEFSIDCLCQGNTNGGLGEEHAKVLFPMATASAALDLDVLGTRISSFEIKKHELLKVAHWSPQADMIKEKMKYLGFYITIFKEMQFLWNLREAEVRADTDNEKTYAFIIMNNPDGKVPNLLDSLKAILNNKFAAGAAVDGVCPDGSEGAFNFATAFSVVLQTGIKFVAEETKGVLGIMMGELNVAIHGVKPNAEKAKAADMKKKHDEVDELVSHSRRFLNATRLEDNSIPQISAANKLCVKASNTSLVWGISNLLSNADFEDEEKGLDLRSKIRVLYTEYLKDRYLM